MAGGLNTYGYVGGNPLSFSDPFGLIKHCIETWVSLGDAWRQTSIRQRVLIRGRIDGVLRVDPNPQVSGNLPPTRLGRGGNPIGLGHGITGVYQDNREWGWENWWEVWAEKGYFRKVCVDECGNETTTNDYGYKRIDNPTIGEWRFDPTSDVRGP